MSLLHDMTNVYIDFEDLIAKTDEFVCHKLWMLKDDKDIVNNAIVKGFYDIINQLGEEYIPEFTNTKQYLNPFVDIANIDNVDTEFLKSFRNSEFTDIDIKSFLCDQLYDEIMYYEYAFNENNIIEFTNLSNSLRILLKDKKLEKLYIYVKIHTEFICKTIYDFFDNNEKVIIVTGDKQSFFNNQKCDTYMFKDIEDINLLPERNEKTDNCAEVVMTNIVHNRNIWDRMKDKNTDVISHVDIEKKYNVNVSILN